MRLVEVRWIDSTRHGDSTWVSRSEVISAAEDGPLTCWTAGYLLHEDDRQVTIVLSHSGEDGEVQAPLTIPRSAVSEISDLRRERVPLVTAPG